MIIKEQIPISIYGNEERTLHIYVPDFLEEGQRCGVIYMYDGHNLFNDEDSTYGVSWGIREYLEATGIAVIVVGLECNHEGNLRLCEFSPYSFKDKTWGDIRATGKSLTRWIIKELKPYIDENYPTIPDREHTAIGGSSMGGLMAIYGGVRMSQYISRAICISPYHSHVMNRLIKDCQRELWPDTKFYISWGGNECASKRALATYTEANLRIARELEGKAEVYLHLYPDQDHSEGSWSNETDIWMNEMGITEWGIWEE